MLLLWNPWNSCAYCSSPCSEHLRLWGNFDFIFFFSLRILQTLGSTEASAEFITVALERGKKGIGPFLLPCCVFFFLPCSLPLTSTCTHRLRGGLEHSSLSLAGMVMERAFSGHPQLQLHLRALEWGTPVTLGFSPFYIPVLFVYLQFFYLGRGPFPNFYLG